MDEKFVIQRKANGWTLETPNLNWDSTEELRMTYVFEDSEDQELMPGIAMSLHKVLWEAFSEYFQSKRDGGLKMDVRDKGWAEGDDKSLLGLDDEGEDPVILTDNVKIS
jgi:hypothetical protein